MDIGERLGKLMEAKNINRRQLSIASRIPYTTIDGIMKHNCANVKLTTLIKLADYFEISLDYLVGRGAFAALSLEEFSELTSFMHYLEWRKEYGQT